LYPTYVCSRFVFSSLVSVINTILTQHHQFLFQVSAAFLLWCEVKNRHYKLKHRIVLLAESYRKKLYLLPLEYITIYLSTPGILPSKILAYHFHSIRLEIVCWRKWNSTCNNKQSIFSLWIIEWNMGSNFQQEGSHPIHYCIIQTPSCFYAI
jgi:hypothetical protein